MVFAGSIPNGNTKKFTPDEDRPTTFVLVPQFNVPDVGHVDFAIFVPQISRLVPLVVVECDGHDFHERTREQASNDNRRDRTLQRLCIPVLRFTATDVLRNKCDVAREIAEFVHEKLHTRETECAQTEEVLWQLEHTENELADVQSKLKDTETRLEYAQYGLP